MLYFADDLVCRLGMKLHDLSRAQATASYRPTELDQLNAGQTTAIHGNGAVELSERRHQLATGTLRVLPDKAWESAGMPWRSHFSALITRLVLVSP